ncbi:jg8720 [Pararge aegeria aegeria]|uniref:Jg8720 protein n=1 Tax=Pararge aegeria aegeria TaxID=348720 RepID=A0A8S4S5Z8_9NEOP|nr:jg8720 [Pararge aegeria aegeria]
MVASYSKSKPKVPRRVIPPSGQSRHIFPPLGDPMLTSQRPTSCRGGACVDLCTSSHTKRAVLPTSRNLKQGYTKLKTSLTPYYINKDLCPAWGHV